MPFDEMKILQLNILQTIHDFCIQNNIKYSIACGTLLGAVRHKGYIPWDDDIDIFLLRDDYELLLAEFPQNLDHIKIASLSRDPTWEHAYAKAYDDRTLVRETSTVVESTGVNIDIFPIDKVPKEKNQWNSYNKKRKIILKMFYIKYLRLSKNRPILKNLLHSLAKIILIPLSRRKIAELLNKYAQKYNHTDSPLVFENVQGWISQKPFPQKAMESTIDMQFENRTFKGMSGFDDYLKNTYGDYLTLPPIEKRVNHHLFSPYWKN